MFEEVILLAITKVIKLFKNAITFGKENVKSYLKYHLRISIQFHVKEMVKGVRLKHLFVFHFDFVFGIDIRQISLPNDTEQLLDYARERILTNK